MHFLDRTYMVFNVDEIDKIDFSKVMEDSTETLHYSLDGTKSYVKYKLEPAFVATMDVVSFYNWEEIMDLLTTSEWLLNE